MRSKSIAALIGILVLLLAMLQVFAAAAQGPTPSDDEVNAIAKELYCPVCPNEPLDTCSSLACVQWREIIREKLAEGWTADQIKQYFVEQYGDRVLSTPPARGLNWLVYVLPPLAFLIGLFVLVRAMRNWSRAADAPLPEPIDSDDLYIERVEEELRKRK
jgi:cytochrome c-type biogenesis protein CcmH